MDLKSALSLIGLFLTLLVAFLFFRYIYWGFISRMYYWKKPAELSADIPLPSFTIMIPARDEAGVIASTIDHMASLDYPNNKYEIVVITDEKELRDRTSGTITTQDVVEKLIKELSTRKNSPVLKHLIVPYDFDGRVEGIRIGKEVKSTKARALNYGLNYISRETTICSFFDAESRPEPHVLRCVAARYLNSGRKQKLWQGPVFQVRNFFQIGPINKAIALFQALAHEWYLPILLKHLPFLGGTNLHVERKLLLRIGGYDPTALSEDLELGVRTYLETMQWPEYIPVVSTEQTPATYKAYFRQRLRWGSGHLQVYDKLRASTSYPDSMRLPLLRTLYWRGHAQWFFFQLLFMAPYFILILTLMGKLDPRLIPDGIKFALSWLTPIYYSFAFYLFYRFRHFIYFSTSTHGILRFLPVLQLAIVPIAGIFIALPFTSALILRTLNRQPQAWIKTPRTEEIRTSVI